MAYSSSILRYMIQVQNRKTAKGSKFGLDGDGIEWEDGDFLHCNITFAKGARAMNAGALDAYTVKEVRMRWTNKITMRSRVKYQGNIYQILPETYHEDLHTDVIQFHMQLIVNDK